VTVRVRGEYLVVALAMAVALAVSLLLLPRDGELALQAFRDRAYSVARTAFETRFAAGDRSAATVLPLTRLMMQDGEIERAIAVMEDFVTREPGRIEGRQLLGTLYQDAQRMGDYMENLEEIVRRRPAEDAVRELVTLSRFYGRTDRQVAALERLANLRPADAGVAVELASLLAARGKIDEATGWLSRADDRTKGGIGEDGRELLAEILVRTGRVDEAFARAGRWLAGTPPEYAVLALAGQIAAAGRSDLAYRLLLPFAQRALSEDGLTFALVDAELATGRAEAARARLQARQSRRPLEDAWVGRFVGLALSAGLPGEALDEARRHDLRLVVDWALAGVAEVAFNTGDREFLDRMLGELGELFLEDRPLLAGDIALMRGDGAGAGQWARRVLGDGGAPLVDALGALHLLVRAGEKDEATLAFDRLAGAGRLAGETVPEPAVGGLGSLFIDLGRAPAGLAWFSARSTAHPASLAAGTGWARLAARVGDATAVTAWLAAHGDIDTASLDDIATAAAGRGEAGLALAAAKQLAARDPASPRVRLALGTALLMAGRAAEAAGVLGPIVRESVSTEGAGKEGASTEDDGVEALWLAALDAAGAEGELAAALDAGVTSGRYDAARQRALAHALLARGAVHAALPLVRLRAAGERGEPRGEWLYAYVDVARTVGAHDELTALLADLLDDAGAAAQQREAAASLLLEEAPARASAALTRLAGDEPGRWGPLALEALRQRGDGDELRRLTLTLAGDTRLPAARRRELAFALMDLDAPQAAERVFRALAAGQSPDGPDVRQLRYLWGPRPEADALDWVEARARRAGPPGERAAWLRLMVELGGQRRIATLLDSDGGAAADPGLRDIHIEALAAAGRWTALAQAVRAALPGERDPERLRHYARTVEQAGDETAALEAWRAVLARAPDDSEALRRLGFAAFADNRLDEAERHLRRLLAPGPGPGRGDGDHESNYVLAETLTATRRPAEAPPFYRRALEQIRAVPARDDAIRQTEAAILHRLGQVDAAAALYRDLLRRHPRDVQLRADFASMLIDTRRIPEARAVLDGQ
jgi:tetratricopeptide (TPR) repeat protein